MTDQPTWTPERALEMLRDWKDISVLKFNAKWPGVEDIDDVAIAALESAAAEIERQKARADAAEKEREHLARIIGDHLDEIERLRAELAAKQPADSEAVTNSPIITRLSVGRLEQPAEAEAAQQGPSDEVIRDALANHIHGPELRHVLRLLARRAGVKL